MSLSPVFPGKNLPTDISASPSNSSRDAQADFSSDDRNKLPSAPLLDPPPPQHDDADDYFGLDLIANLVCDDGAAHNAGNPPDSEDMEVTTELDRMKEELQRRKEENRELKANLSLWNSKYEELRMQVQTYIQQRHAKHTQSIAPKPRKVAQVQAEAGADAEMVPAQPLAPASGTTGQSTARVTVKNVRIAVRTRSESAISDGGKWRKYGKRTPNGNPNPRGYYRCTMAVGCPVRKQVQRSAEDKNTMVTTYEGEHNHPLPPAAMAMVSTTTSAARMLVSGLMSSDDPTTMNPNLIARAICPNSAMASLSTAGPLPTLTLDFTDDTNNTPNALHNPNQSAPTAPLLPQPNAHHNQSQFSGLQLSHQDAAGSSPQAAPRLHPIQQLSFDNVSAAAAAAAALSSDPNFMSVIAAAMSSIMSGAQPNNNNKNNNVYNPNIINSSTNSSFSGN